MLHVFLGTDRAKVLTALDKAVANLCLPSIRVSDASRLEDVQAALSGGGMFAEERAVVLDRISDNEEAWNLVFEALPLMADQTDTFFIYEEKVDAVTKKLLQKHAEKVEVFDAPKPATTRPNVFALVNYMQAGDKKKLWVGYQQELATGNAPEAIHGTLFWGAKQALLSARTAKDGERAKKFVSQLAELPHISRRRGEELEYALERFILSCVEK